MFIINALMERTTTFARLLLRGAALLLPLLSVAGLAPDSARAQDRVDPAGMGRGRASVATVRGLGAITSNPGALDLPMLDSTSLPQRLTFSVYNLGGAFGSTYLSSTEFAEIFGNAPKDRQRLGDLLQDERLFANGAINLLAVRYRTDAGTWGLHFGERIFARVNLPDDFAEVVQTLNFAGQDYQFTNRGIGGDWISELGLSYGTVLDGGGSGNWFPRIGVGATAKLVLGVAHFDVADNSVIRIENLTRSSRVASVLRGGFVFRSATPDGFNAQDASGELLSGIPPGVAGTGFGIDLGVAGVLYRAPIAGAQGEPRATDAIYYGVALTDLGSISWSKNLYERRLTGVSDTIFGSSLTDTELQKYQGALVPVDPFSSDLPTAIRVGLGANLSALFPSLPTGLELDVEGEAPLIDRPGNSPDYRLSAGVNWGLVRWLTLRAGIGKVGTSQADVAFGLGLRPIDWLSIDLATADINGLFDGARVDFAGRIAAGLDF